MRMTNFANTGYLTTIKGAQSGTPGRERERMKKFLTVALTPLMLIAATGAQAQTKINLGTVPLALGSPGIEAPRAATGCI